METKDINVERAAKLDTATLSDALDKLGIPGQCYRRRARDRWQAWPHWPCWA